MKIRVVLTVDVQDENPDELITNIQEDIKEELLECFMGLLADYTYVTAEDTATFNISYTNDGGFIS